jgi:hypothetical protein
VAAVVAAKGGKREGRQGRAPGRLTGTRHRHPGPHRRPRGSWAARRWARRWAGSRWGRPRRRQAGPGVCGQGAAGGRADGGVGGIWASPVLYDPDAGIPNSHCNAHMHTQPQGSPIENAVCGWRHRLLQGEVARERAHGGGAEGVKNSHRSRRDRPPGQLRHIVRCQRHGCARQASGTAREAFGDSFRAVLAWRSRPAGTLFAACRRANWGRPSHSPSYGACLQRRKWPLPGTPRRGLQASASWRQVVCLVCEGGMGGSDGNYMCERCCLNAPGSAGMAPMRWDPAAWLPPHLLRQLPICGASPMWCLHAADCRLQATGGIAKAAL